MGQSDKNLVSLTAAEHIGPTETGDNIDAKRVASYVWNGSSWDRMSQPSSGATVPTTVVNGKKTVTTAGTRVALASSTAVAGVVIQALSTNTGLVYVGDVTVASGNGFELQAGQATGLAIDNLSKVYIDSAVNGEGVVYLAS